MKNQSLLGCLKPLVTVVLFNFILVTNGVAADTFAPTWNLSNIGSQTRELTTNYTGTGAVIGGGSVIGSATHNSLTVNGLTVSTETDPKTAYENGADFIAGGAVYDAVGDYNQFITSGGTTIQGRTVLGGVALLDNIDNRLGTGSANNNTVSMTNSTVSLSSGFIPSGSAISIQTGGDVVGGLTNYINGHADGNSVLLNNTTVAGNVFGGVVVPHFLLPSDYDNASYTADYNRVQIFNGSNVTGNVFGAYGVASSEGNSVLVDNATVSNVLGVYTASPSSLLYANEVVLQNGAVADAAYTVYGNSVNAIGNVLDVDNATVNNGELYTARVGLAQDLTGPINAHSRDNVLYLSNMPVVSANEIGSVLNWSGSSNGNGVLLDTMAGLTLTRVDPVSFGMLSIPYLASYNLWSVRSLGGLSDMSGALANNGFVYAGASIDYTTQMNNLNVPLSTSIMADTTTGELLPAFVDGEVPSTTILANVGAGGTSSDGNVVYIANSNVTSNILGGMAAQLQQIDYATWAYTAPSSGTATVADPAKYTKTSLVKNGNTLISTTTQYEYDGSAVTEVGSESTYDIVKKFEKDVYSASNNTVVIEDSYVKGTVYAGYVIGADLDLANTHTSDNMVVLRGNTTLYYADENNLTVLYGGNASLGQTTNTLVFDHVGNNGSFVTYNSKGHFRNFNKVWQINADLNTRINFNFKDVVALVNVDMQNVQEGSATIIKAQTATDMSNVIQNGVVTDLVDNSVGLASNRLGIYTFSLTGTKVDATTVGWVLSSIKDSANAEVYGQSPLAGVALALQGQDLLATTMQEAWSTDAEMNTFVGGGYDKTRYTTGSGFDLQSGLIQAGMWKKLSNNWLGGFFLKYAGGHYDTFPISAKGEISSYGGGLMTSLQYSETGRLEANVEAGYMKIDFESSDLRSNLKTQSAYYGGMFGLVQTPVQYWDLFARVQYLHKNADSTTDNLQQKVKYDAINSLSVRAGTEYAFGNLNWGGLVPSLGVSGIYEFDGESKVEVLGLSDSHASLKGFSGRGEVGLSYASEDSFLPILSKLTVFGQAGKRRGFGVEANLSFQF